MINTMSKKIATTITTLVLGFGTFTAVSDTATSDEAVPFEFQIKARQAVMTIYAFNLTALGMMAKGDIPYDAELATNSSNNLLATVNMKNGGMWPVGSDASADGLAGVTAAKPEVWSNYPEVAKHHEELAEAIAEMAAVAGNGLDAVRGAMSGIGGACKGCHDDFRLSDD